MKYLRIMTLASIAGALAVSAGCDRTSAEERDRALTAQREADEKITAAERAGDKTAAEAQRKADEATAKARYEVNEDTSQAQAKANDVIRAAQEGTVKLRTDLREWAQKQLSSIDHDIDASKTKAQTASVKVKQDFGARLADVEGKRKALQADVDALETQAGSALDQWKPRVQKELDALQASVSRLGV